MNIISWNCNMAFRNKCEKVLKLKPDLLVIQECENQEKLKNALDNMDYNDILWHGQNPHKGVAAISFNDVKLSLKSGYSEEFQYIIPLELKSKKRLLNLFHIWAMPHITNRKKDYIGQIWGALNYFSEFLKEDSIWIGDFNSNAIWDKKKRIGNHTDVVNRLEEYKIRSLYHQQTREMQGQELEPTLYLLKKMHKPYHMDFCFLSDNLINENTKISIGDYDDWISLSDHMPIFIKSING